MLCSQVLITNTICGVFNGSDISVADSRCVSVNSKYYCGVFNWSLHYQGLTRERQNVVIDVGYQDSPIITVQKWLYVFDYFHPRILSCCVSYVTLQLR